MRRSTIAVHGQCQTTAWQAIQEALQILSEHPDSFDLVISDMAMPNLSGDKFIEKIRSIRSGIAAVICTGNRDKLTTDAASQLGINKIIMKPIEKEIFTAAVREVLDDAG